MKCAVLYFVKTPEPGKVKTRLARSIGILEAARLYRELAWTNFQTLQKSSQDYTVIVLFDPPDADEKIIRGWLQSTRCRYFPQAEGGLSEKLTQGFKQAFKEFDCVLATGSDTIGLCPQHIENAFDVLRQHDVVLGPAEDGGYYLIGLKKDHPELFQKITWSISSVLEETLQRIQQQDLSWDKIDTLSDLDDERQLHSLKRKE